MSQNTKLSAEKYLTRGKYDPSKSNRVAEAKKHERIQMEILKKKSFKQHPLLSIMDILAGEALLKDNRQFLKR